jgi:glycosyltransferase involved in cell wall biosynthesis
MLPDFPLTRRDPPVDEAWQIVQAARLVPKKGFATALHAFAAFGRQYPKATFVIAGDGPMEAELRKLTNELGINGRVRFAGFVSQDALQKLFSGSHIFLHPSETAAGDVEGVPNAMLEAMACGLPVVATRHGGIPEAIEHGRNGLLCAERDTDGVAAALLRLANDAVLYRTLTQQASASVHEQFAKERQVAVIEKVYGDAILAHSERTSANARS